MANELIFEDIQPDPLTFSEPELKPLHFLTDIQGQSLYLSWLELGHEGTKQDFLEWLRGSDGINAYEIWLAAGNEGTVQDYLNSLKGKSQYQSYLDTTSDNPPLSEAEWSAGFSNKYFYINYPRVSFGGTIGKWARAFFADRGLLLSDNTAVSDANQLVNVTLGFATSIYIAECKCKIRKINERMNTSRFGVAIMKGTYNFINGQIYNKTLVYEKSDNNGLWYIVENINSDVIINPGEVVIIFHLPYISNTSHGSVLIELEKVL
jgi:hypothetical protein